MHLKDSAILHTAARHPTPAACVSEWFSCCHSRRQDRDRTHVLNRSFAGKSPRVAAGIGPAPYGASKWLRRRGGFMWLLLAINAVMLVGLLFTVWRLRHLQAVLAIQKAAAPAAVHRAVKPAEPRRREPPASIRARRIFHRRPASRTRSRRSVPGVLAPRPTAARPIVWRRSAADPIRRSPAGFRSRASSSSSSRGRFAWRRTTRRPRAAARRRCSDRRTRLR